MLLVKKEKPTILSDRRLVKAADIAVVKQAGEIVDAAEAEAAAIHEQAQKDAEEKCREGYEKGLADGKMEIAMQKMDLVDSSVKFMESVEGKMADIVMKALHKCVAEIGDEELVVQVVKKLMAAVIRTQRQVTVKVPPDKVETVKARVAELRMNYPTVDSIDVVEDSRLSGTAAVLETEAGVADASIDVQLAAIETSLKRHMTRPS